MSLAETFNGGAWLNLDLDGKAYLVLSNDKTYDPEWTNNDGISTIAVENAPAVYFNLNGVQVANPANGLFIKKQGNVVTKVIVK